MAAQGSQPLEPTMPDAAKKILGGQGKQLHTHEVHLRRTKNKGYIARHDLRDKNGNPAADGQRNEAEYALPDKAAMLAHIEQHMGEMPEENEGPPQ
jgi:hypothetical protein